MSPTNILNRFSEMCLNLYGSCLYPSPRISGGGDFFAPFLVVLERASECVLMQFLLGIFRCSLPYQKINLSLQTGGEGDGVTPFLDGFRKGSPT